MSQGDSTNKNQSNPKKIISIQNVHKTYLLGVEGVTALRGLKKKKKKIFF